MCLLKRIAIVSAQLNGFKNCYLHKYFYLILIICMHTVKWFQYCYLIMVILFNTVYLFAHSLMVPSIAMYH